MQSGKLVTKLFSRIIDIVDDPKILVCLLIDEVESLAHARDKCQAGTEPSDAIRVVNALLTQIDQLKRYPNVIILTTSNLTDSIDVAFVDRADIKQFIGPPNNEAIYQIYRTCIEELCKKHIIRTNEFIHPHTVFQLLKFDDVDHSEVYKASKQLVDLSTKSQGFSGRTLRKIPFLAHALFLSDGEVSLNDYYDALDKAIDYEKNQRLNFKNNS